MKVDVIILSLTNSPILHGMTQNAINSLHNSEKDIEFNVILVESNKEWTPEEYPYHLVDKILIPESEFNYNRYCKIGVQHCRNEWVALCNNDLIFHPGWFSEILRTHKYTDGIFNSYTPWNPYEEWHYRLMGGDFDVFEGYRTSYEVGGWCLVTKRELLNKIDLSDRVNFWYSDNIYIDEMRKIGVRHALVRNSRVSHICSATSSKLDGLKIYELTNGQQKPYLEGR